MNIFTTTKVATVDLGEAAREAFETAKTGTNSWIERIEELNRLLGITDGHLNSIDQLMNSVAPPGGEGGGGGGGNGLSYGLPPVTTVTQ